MKRIMLACLFALPAFGANELTVNAGINYTKNGVTISDNKSGAIDVSATPIASGVTAISTNFTEISFGTVASPGYVMLINATTNSWSSIAMGTVSNTYSIKLKGNESAIFRLNTNSLCGVAATNSVDLKYIILSD